MDSKISRLKTLINNLSDEDAKKLLNVINDNYELVNTDFYKSIFEACSEEIEKEYYSSESKYFLNIFISGRGVERCKY